MRFLLVGLLFVISSAATAENVCRGVSAGGEGAILSIQSDSDEGIDANIFFPASGFTVKTKLVIKSVSENGKVAIYKGGGITVWFDSESSQVTLREPFLIRNMKCHTVLNTSEQVVRENKRDRLNENGGPYRVDQEINAAN